MAISKEKQKALNAVMKKVNDKFKSNVLSVAKDIEDKLTVKRLLSPSYEFNNMLGSGLVVGKIIEFYGNNSSGKTSMALEIIAENQKKDPEFIAGWFETERSLDLEYLKQFGIDMDRFIIIEQSEELPAEKCMDILRGMASSGQFNVIVMNSVAALLPTKEVTDEMEKANIALIAKLLSKFFRVITAALAENGTTLILINQLRTGGIGGYMTYSTTTGGLSIPFYSSQRVQFKRDQIKAGEPMTAEEGIKVECKVTKNRFANGGNPYTTCIYYARYGSGIDSNLEILNILIKDGILRKAGAWLRYEDEDGEILEVPSLNGMIPGKWNGSAKFNEFLSNDINGMNFFKGLLSNNATHLSDEEVKALENLEKEQEEHFKDE